MARLHSGSTSAAVREVPLRGHGALPLPAAQTRALRCRTSPAARAGAEAAGPWGPRGSEARPAPAAGPPPRAAPRRLSPPPSGPFGAAPAAVKRPDFPAENPRGPARSQPGPVPPARPVPSRPAPARGPARLSGRAPPAAGPLSAPARSRQGPHLGRSRPGRGESAGSHSNRALPGSQGTRQRLPAPRPAGRSFRESGDFRGVRPASGTGRSETPGAALLYSAVD